MLRPALLTAAIAVVWLVVEPHTVDMAAHTYRADLFGAEGLTLWNGNWYAGHHTPAYSLLFPPLAWLIGPWLAGALSVVAAALVFEPLARRHWGDRGRFAAWWFAAGVGGLLFTGRLPYALGVAIGLGALLALQRGRPRLAVALAVATSLASPIAGAFLALAGVAGALARRGRGGAGAPAWVAAGALTPIVVLGAAFPEGGYMPFAFSAYAPVPLFCLILFAVLPRRERALRIGLVLYGLATTVAFAVETPMGSNAVRLAALFAGPVAVAAVPWPKRRLPATALGLAFAALAVWQVSSPTRDFRASQDEPSAATSYYKPLLDYLETRRPEDGRVEIPFTRSHWEASEVARRFPLARGWERQLDAGKNALFYHGILADFTYANWLAEHGVQLVALADVKPDESSFGERALIERKPPYLKLVRRLPHWRIYDVTLPHPMVVQRRGADVRLERLRSDELLLDVVRPGPTVLRVRWSPYWRTDNGCVERAGEWTRFTPERAGRARITMSFSPVRVLDRGPRCG